MSAVLLDPASLLDAQFHAQLSAELNTSAPIAFLDASLTGSQTITLTLDVTSPSRSRNLVVQRLSYNHEIGGSLSIGGEMVLMASQLQLQSELSSWTPGDAGQIVVDGAGAFTLPQQLRSVLTSPTSNLTGSFRLTDSGRGTARRTTVDLRIGSISLSPALNPLEISARSLALRWSKSGSAAWAVELVAEFTESWPRVAQRLKAAGIVDLPELERLPDLSCRSTIAVTMANTDVTLRMEVSEPSRLGPFPIFATNAFFEFKARVGEAWTASGSGRFSSRDTLAALIPFEQLPVACSLSVPAAPGELPTLDFTIAAGLPPLVLPPILPGGRPVEVLRLDQLTIRFGTELELAARVRLLPSLGNTATRLGLPAQLRPLLDPLIDAVRASTGELRFLLRDNQPRLRIKLGANPSAAPLDLFGLFAQAVPGAVATPASGARASASMSPLLLVKPATLIFEASSFDSAEPRMHLSVAALCTVQGETFDATLSIAAAGPSVQISLLAGTSDPILIRVPASGMQALGSTVDQQIRAVLNLYGISRSSQTGRDLEAVGTRLRQIFSAPDVDTLLAFEIVNLGLTLRLEPAQEPLSIAGGIRIVQFPPILDAIFTGPTPALIIGSSGTSVFIELRPAPAAGDGTAPSPLIRVPVTGNKSVDVVIHALRFGYSWQPPAFELTLRSDVIAPDMPFNGGVGFKLPPGHSTTEIDLQVPSPPAPPVPMLNWRLSFLGASPTPSSRGLEFIVGASDTDRLLTVYLRETVFSPCFFLLMPGGVLDWGVFLGPPPEARTRNTFYVDFRCGRGTMFTISPVVGVLLNPMALLPPFLTATPPYWVIPPVLMGDYFTDETSRTGVEFRANIPPVIEFEAIVKRPLPTLTLQMFLEVALLVSQQFAVSVPPGSSLKNLFYAGLSGRVRIPALDALFGTSEATLAANIEFNVVEILNSAIRLSQQIRTTIEDAARALDRATQLVGNLVNDPKLVVRMVPRQHRCVALETRFNALGFSLDCHLSAYLLLPDELREELRMYHESVRPTRKDPGTFDETPPGGPLVDSPIQFDREGMITWIQITNQLGFIRETTLTRIKTRKNSALMSALRKPLATATSGVLGASADQIAADIASSSGVARRAILLRYGLGPKESEIDLDDKQIPNRNLFRSTIAAKIRPEIQRTTHYTLEVMRGNSVVGKNPSVDHAGLEAAAATLVSNALMPGRPNTTPVTRTNTKNPFVFRGKRMRDWFRGFRPDLRDLAPATPFNDTDEPQGYEIRIRPEHAALAPDFSVVVPRLGTRFQVKLLAGNYRLIVRTGSGQQSTVLPAAFVASVPFGPRKAAELQQRLRIVERRVKRPLTQAEKTLRQEGHDQHIPGLYKKSLFYSPEYEIRPDGGKRGVLSLADLLRKDDGTYVVPDQPIAIAGFRLEILKPSTLTGGLNSSLNVRFCGLIAPGSHLLCFGYAEQTLRFGSFRAELRGEFRLAVGNVAPVAIPGSTAIASDSMTFEGTVLLRDGNRELLSGATLARIETHSGTTTMHLSTTVHVEWSNEFEPGGVKMLKAWISADVDVDLTLGRTLAVSVDTGITFHYSVGEFDTDIVEIGFVVCVPLTNMCWRETERVEVTDLTQIVWGPEQTVSGRLKLALTSSSAGATFAGTVSANIPLPSGGTFPLNAILTSFTL
jgi:hypothetical protein